MARDRWTLTLILICLPILATVITAFRIRDLPKPHDSAKLDTKNTQQCDHCDVKVGHKVHSVKIESETLKYEDLKKVVREKQQLSSEKFSEAKSKHKYTVTSDEDDDNDDGLEFSKVQTGFRQEYPKVSKLDKSELNVKTKVSATKTSFGISKGDEEDEDDDDNISVSKLMHTPKVAETKKFAHEKSKHDLKSTVIKAAQKSKQDTSESRGDDNDDDDDSDDDDNDDEDDDDDDDSYEGLENIEELFKILEMKKPDSKLNSVKKEQKPNILVDIKSQKPTEIKKVIKGIGADDDDDDDDEEDKTQKSKILKMSTKPIAATSIDSKHKKEPVKGDDKSTNSPQKKQEFQTNLRVAKVKSEDHSSKPAIKDSVKVVKKEENKQEPKETSTAGTQIDTVKKDDKISKIKKDEHPPKQVIKQPAKISEKDMAKAKDQDKQSIQIQKEDKKDHKDIKIVDDIKKEKKENKITDEKTKNNAAKKSEEEHVKPKLHEKDDKGTSLEGKKAEKKVIQEPKKVEHTDIPKTSETRKFDFEKPNAYKDRQSTFDYSEFEKMQVSIQHDKDHRKSHKADSCETKNESPLQHATDALYRRNLMKSEFEDFYAFLPTFAPNFSRIHNPECRRHGQILLRQLRGTKLWALNMLDATAKIPSGVLQGNGIQLGDFDQCLGSRARVQLDRGSVIKVQGKYCLARIDVKAESAELEAPVYLAQAKNLMRSRIDDPGHFVPRFSTLSWGVCVPSTCGPEDVEVILKDAVKHYQHKSGVVIRAKVDEEDCHTDDGTNWEEWLELPTILTLSMYGVIILLVIVATVQDFIARRQSEESQNESDDSVECDQKEKDYGGNKERKQSDGFLSSFSLYRTINKLTAPGSTDEIACIHGVRGIATIALLVAHKFMPVAATPYTNRLRITEIASSPLWSWCRAGWVYTDCFLLLSGALTAHRIAGDNDTGAVRRLLSRYLRLTPALLAVVLFYAYIWDKLSAGPLWGTFVTKNARICQDGWWWNLLYVQNYFGLEDMCAPQTHQLALDMQLTIVGGVIVWVAQSGQGVAKLVLPGVHLLAAYMRYTTVRDHRLTLLAYHGVSVSQLYRTARLSYTSTLHRCSPYLVGLSLGLALKKPSRHGMFLLALGWITSIILWLLVMWSGIDSGSTQYRYNAIFAARYAAIAPVASAMAIAWVIYAVHSGTCDFLSRFLCWRPLVFISRLSYALYLCQFIIFITNVGTVRTSKEFTLISLIDVQEISAILLLATILTLTFVIPMQSLKAFSFRTKSETDEKPQEDAIKSEPKVEKSEHVIEEKKEVSPIRSRYNLIAHREVLEEILEVDVEYETQRENNAGLDEIIEEEEGTTFEEEETIDDLEIIEEEEADEEEALLERVGERSYSRGSDHDLDEWEWTNGRNGAQCYRYSR